MPAPDINLPSPFVMLTQSAGSLGIVPRQGISIGYVEKVYSTSDYLSVGQYVLFEIAKAGVLMYGSTIYYMVSDEFVSGQETDLP